MLAFTKLFTKFQSSSASFVQTVDPTLVGARKKSTASTVLHETKGQEMKQRKCCMQNMLDSKAHGPQKSVTMLCIQGDDNQGL